MVQVHLSYTVDDQYTTATVEMRTDKGDVYGRLTFNRPHLETLIGELRQFKASPGNQPYIEPQTNVSFDRTALDSYIKELFHLSVLLRSKPYVSSFGVNLEQPPNAPPASGHREAGPAWPGQSGSGSGGAWQGFGDGTGGGGSGGGGGHGAL